jgi:hypothetical protein
MRKMDISEMFPRLREKVINAADGESIVYVDDCPSDGEKRGFYVKKEGGKVYTSTASNYIDRCFEIVTQECEA